MKNLFENLCNDETMSTSKTHPNPVLDLLHAHRVSPKLLRNKKLNLFAIRTRFTSSVRKSAPLQKEETRESRHAELDSAFRITPSSDTSCHLLPPMGRRQFSFGFTLAEVLITLGIIGVVAALTLPSLIEKHQKIVLVNQLKKVYTEMSQAAKQIMVDEGADDLIQTSLAVDDLTDENIKNSAGKFLNKYFKIAKDCGLERSECFAENYKTLNGSVYEDERYNIDYYYHVILSNGASIAMSPGANSINSVPPVNGFIDVNGPNKGPNTFGRDMYYYSLYYDGSIAEVAPECRKDDDDCSSDPLRKTDDFWESGENSCNNGGYGGCLDKIIRDGWVMDY